MISNPIKKLNPGRGQAIVEFMLTLPILLALIYGTIEVGRLIFIFSSVANASRQAARYGSAAGDLGNITFYQDCAGIRKVAKESAILTSFNKINITYDRGVASDGSQIPIRGVDPNPYTNTCPIKDGVIRNGDRIIVQVNADYEPILPIIPIGPVSIVSASARTFLISIPIMGSALPTGFAGESPTPSNTPIQVFLTNTATMTLASTSTNTPFVTNPNWTPIKHRTSTVTFTPSITFTPSRTPLPTNSPTATSTAIICSGSKGVGHGPLTIPDKSNLIEMKVNNNSGYTLTIAQIFIEWNHDTGHNNKNNPSLHLNRVSLANQTWNGDLNTPFTNIPGYYPLLPPGESTIQFSFNQSYDIPDGTERVIITIGNPGCTNYPIDSQK